MDLERVGVPLAALGCAGILTRRWWQPHAQAWLRRRRLRRAANKQSAATGLDRDLDV